MLLGRSKGPLLIASERMKQLGQRGNNAQLWMCLEVKVQSYKEKYCIGTWNVRSMSQGKLGMVKQEMAKVNIDILGIIVLKWMGMGEFNSDDHYTYYCRQESHRSNGVALIVNKRIWNAVLGCNLKNNRMILVRFQGKPFSITVIQVCTLTTDAKEAEVDWFFEDLQHLLTNTKKKKKSYFRHRGLKCKSQKSRHTWNNRHVWPCRTKWSRTKTNRVLLRELAGHSQHPFSATQEMTLCTDISRWSILKLDYVLCSGRWKNSIQSKKKPRLGAGCDSDCELLTAKLS